MAEIRVERKQTSWWWWILGLILLALLAWWAVGMMTDDRDPAAVGATSPGVIAPTTAPGAATESPGASIAEALGNPSAWMGRNFSGEVQVADVPTDRGFWVQQGGNRLFAILVDRPAERPLDINSGQRLRINQGVFHDRSYLPQLAGAQLDADTRRIAESAPIFLVVREADVTVQGQQPTR